MKRATESMAQFCNRTIKHISEEKRLAFMSAIAEGHEHEMALEMAGIKGIPGTSANMIGVMILKRCFFRSAKKLVKRIPLEKRMAFLDALKDHKTIKAATEAGGLKNIQANLILHVVLVKKSATVFDPLAAMEA